MGIDFFLNFKIDSKKFIILNKIGGSLTFDSVEFLFILVCPWA